MYDIRIISLCCLGYEPFCAEIKSLFGADVNSHDVKALFRKIAANPEAEVDWSEVQINLYFLSYTSILHGHSHVELTNAC